MKENISIVGNETIEELVKKVNTVKSMDDKLSVCIMIITHLEMKNSVRPGAYTHSIGISKKHPPKSPEEIEKLNQFSIDHHKNRPSEHEPIDFGSDINTFLFYLKKLEKNCYEDLVNTYEKISEKESAKESLVTFGFIIGSILVFYFLIKMVG